MGGRVRSDQVPDLTQVSGGWGASAPIVPWPFRLKFGREMGTHPGRSVPMFGLGTPTPRIRGSRNGVPGNNPSNYEWFAWVLMLQLAGALQRA